MISCGWVGRLSLAQPPIAENELSLMLGLNLKKIEFKQAPYDYHWQKSK